MRKPWHYNKLIQWLMFRVSGRFFDWLHKERRREITIEVEELLKLGLIKTVVFSIQPLGTRIYIRLEYGNLIRVLNMRHLKDLIELKEESLLPAI